MKSLLLFLLLIQSPSVSVEDKTEKIHAFISSSQYNDPVLMYWSIYSSIRDEQMLRQRYLELSTIFPFEPYRTWNDLAYVQCLTELPRIHDAFILLNSIQHQLHKKSEFTKASFYAIASRFLYFIHHMDDAIRSNKMAISLLEKNRKSERLKWCRINQSFFYAQLLSPKVDDEITEFLKLEQEGNTAFFVMSRTNWAFRHIRYGDADSAAAIIKTADEWVKEHPQLSYLDQYRLLVIHSAIHEVRREFPQQKFYLDQAMNLSEQMGLYNNLKAIYWEKSDIAVKEEDYKAAHEFLTKSDSVAKTLMIEELSHEMEMLKLKEKIESTEKENARVASSMNQQKKQFIPFLFILLMALMTAGILGIRFYRKAKLQETRVPSKFKRKSSPGDENNLQVPEEKREELIAQLHKLINDKKIYCDPHLNLEKLARKLNTNRTYLSESINAEYKMTYTNWINKVRIDAACEQLNSEHFDHLSIEGIAQNCGFSSISTFNSTFKKLMQRTPSQFRNERNKGLENNNLQVGF